METTGAREHGGRGTTGGTGTGGSPVRNYEAEGSLQEILQGMDQTQEKQQKLEFPDMDGYEWVIDAIARVAEKGIVSGYDDGTFRPGNNITRAEFAKLLITAFGETAEAQGGIFQDVPSKHWACGYIEKAAQLGIVHGTEDSRFFPDHPITREDIAAMCYRTLQQSQDNVILKKELPMFTDAADIFDYAEEAVGYLQSVSIISGDETGAFRPKDYACRAEAVKMLDGIMRIGGEK